MLCPTCQGRGIVAGQSAWLDCGTCGGKGNLPDDLGVTLADLPEAAIQEEIIKFLQEDNWRVLITTPVSNRSRGIGFGEVGMPDLICMRTIPISSTSARRSDLYACEVLWLENKSRHGKPQSHQVKWHLDERARGFQTWIASVDFDPSLDGLRQKYEASGLMRRVRWW